MISPLNLFIIYLNLVAVKQFHPSNGVVKGSNPIGTNNPVAQLVERENIALNIHKNKI